MTKEERKNALARARLACAALTPYAIGNDPVILLGNYHREQVADLLDCFGWLDARERKQQSAREQNAQTAGRPQRKSTRSLSSAALYKRARKAEAEGNTALAEKRRTQAAKKRQQEKNLVDKSAEYETIPSSH